MKAKNIEIYFNELVSNWALSVLQRLEREDPETFKKFINGLESKSSTRFLCSKEEAQRLPNKMAISKPINILLNSKMKSSRQKDRCIKRQKI